LVGWVETLVDNTKRAWRARWPVAYVSHRYKLICVPISKVASTSLRAGIATLEFQRVCGAQDADVLRIDYRMSSQFQDYLSFTVMRNPWARLVSCYQNKFIDARKLESCFKRYNELTRCEVFELGMDFSSFLSTICRIPDLASDRHFRSQWRSCASPTGKLLVQKIIRIDELDTWWSEFGIAQGWDTAPLPWLNMSTPLDYRRWYDKRSCDLVRRRYARDIELGQFSF
jgi:hypothetical protein